MRHLFTFSLAALMASSAVTVHGRPLLGNTDAVQGASSQLPLNLNTGQLTQCVTQILGGAKTCDLSLLDGLVPGLLETVGSLLSLDGHILDLSTLTDLVNQAVGSLLQDGTCKQAADCQVGSVLEIVKRLLGNLPVANGAVKRDLLSDVTTILGSNGLTLDGVKFRVQGILSGLNLPYVDLTNLPLHAEDQVCSLLESLDLNCKDVLTLLNQQQQEEQ
ncbi:hypothetical protein BJV82DRAFT_655130 [Fennellomyces sp. T-0311]|nr:hypothetical protein BJV82DRAFT_655130 [Fennellomyces sp. T-0311]